VIVSDTVTGQRRDRLWTVRHSFVIVSDTVVNLERVAANKVADTRESRRFSAVTNRRALALRSAMLRRGWSRQAVNRFRQRKQGRS
jgi:hypothetical protein